MSIQSCLQNNAVVGSLNACTGELEYSDYGYGINKAASYFFVIAFAISTLLHIGQAIKFRTWSMLWSAAACALLETLGWGGRLGSALTVRWYSDLGGYYESSNESYFLMQICCLIIAPAFLAAAIYIILGWVINYTNPKYSVLPPRVYLILFIVGDVISLVLQAIGGGTASGADDLDGANRGGKIMLAGIIFQLFIMLAFFFVYFVFVNRLRKASAVSSLESDRKINLLLFGIGLSMLFVFVRSVYRVAELSDGWESDIIHNQGLFIALDGVMMVIATYLINIFHPGAYLPKGRHSVGSVPSDSFGEKANGINAQAVA